MRKIFFLFSLLILFTKLSAQNQLPKYYAIDGSVWVAKHDRDKKEKLIWENINLDLKTALLAGRLGTGTEGEANYEAFQKLFLSCQDALQSIRLADMGKESLQNAEFRFFLSQNGVKARNGVARNGEPFNLEEYARCFDAALNEYLFNANIIAELSKTDGETYNLEFVINDFYERVELVQDRIEREKQLVQLKEEAIKTLTPIYKERKAKASTKTKQTKK